MIHDNELSMAYQSGRSRDGYHELPVIHERGSRSLSIFRVFGLRP
jgi:hypothetical protein